MSVVKISYCCKVLTTLVFLVLSGTACLPTLPTLPTTVPTTPSKTVVIHATKTKTPTTVTTPVTTASVTALRSLNVRVRPGEQSASIGYLYNGDAVTLTGTCQTGWAQIVWKGGRAWVNASFLSENKCKAEK